MTMHRGDKMMLALCAGLMAIMAVSIALWATGHPAIGHAVSTLGTLLWMSGWVVYVIAWDSRRRWPGRSPSERAYRLFTFKR